MASCLEAAEALAFLGMKVKDVREKDLKQALKLAKKIVRDILLWRCAGNALGLDSREALIRAFEETCSHTHCDENTDSQLSNGYRRIHEGLATNTWVRNSSATSPMERHRKAEEQRAQLDCWAGSCSCSYKLHTFQHWKAAAPEQAARNRQTNGCQLVQPCLIPWLRADWTQPCRILRTLPMLIPIKGARSRRLGVRPVHAAETQSRACK